MNFELGDKVHYKYGKASIAYVVIEVKPNTYTGTYYSIALPLKSGKLPKRVFKYMVAQDTLTKSNQ